MLDKRLVIDFETTGKNTYDDTAIGVAVLGRRLGVYNRPTYITQANIHKHRDKLIKLIEDPTVKVLNWSSKFDMHFACKTLDISPFQIKNLVDVQLLFHLFDETRYTKRGAKLKLVGEGLFGDWAVEEERALEQWLKRHQLKREEMFRAPVSVMRPYAVKDVLLTDKLYDWVIPRFNSELIRAAEIDTKLIPVLCEMEQHGVAADKEYLIRLLKTYQRRRKISLTKINKFIPDSLNLNSPPQLSKFIYEKLGLDPIAKTKGGQQSVDQYALQAIYDKHGHPFIAELLNYKHIDHTISTFVSPMINAIKSDGRVHTSFNLCFTTTGRLSSSGPNLQNVEKDAEKRKFVIFKPGTIGIDFDYDQIELRLFAHYINDQKMINDFNAGKDIHLEAAKDVLGRDKISKKERDKIGKSTNFGIIFGMGAATMALKMGVSLDEAQHYIKMYLTRRKGIFQLRSAIDRVVRDRGYVRNWYGRRRHLTQRTAYKGLNAIIQSTAAYVIKEKMISFRSKIDPSIARMILQVHDELLIETYNESRKASDELANLLENHNNFSLPLTGNYKLQKERWFEDE